MARRHLETTRLVKWCLLSQFTVSTPYSLDGAIIRIQSQNEQGYLIFIRERRVYSLDVIKYNDFFTKPVIIGYHLLFKPKTISHAMLVII